jgi:hypothetical protein
MLHLTGEPVEKYVLDEIDEYEKRLAKKVENDKSLAKAMEEYEVYEEYLLGLGPEHYPGHAPFPFQQQQLITERPLESLSLNQPKHKLKKMTNTVHEPNLIFLVVRDVLHMFCCVTIVVVAIANIANATNDGSNGINQL